MIMPTSLLLFPSVVALLAGIMVLVRPELLNYFVAAYLIVVGLTGIWHVLSL